MSSVAKSALLGALLTLAAVAARGVEAPAVNGKLESVTLYRGQALVTRAVPVEAPAGKVELVVGELPEQIQPDSLFAEAGAGIEVRAVRYRARAVGEEPREAVRKLDLEMEAVEQKTARNKRLQEVATQRNAALDKMINFTTPTATFDLGRGVLNAEALKGVVTFEAEQRKLVAEELLTLATEAKDLEKQATLLKQKRAELSSTVSRVVREAVLFLDKAGAGRAEVKVSYLAGGAGWSPAYNFRADKDGKTVKLEYNALIFQQSGEDWNGVALTLSTASPHLSAVGPGLAPFRVTLARPAANPPAQQMAGQNFNAPNQEDVSGQFKAYAGRQQRAQAKQQTSVNFDEQVGNAWSMNSVANDLQVLELVNPKDVLRIAQQELVAAREGPSVSYLLNGAVSLASRSDQQLVRISEMKLEGKLYYVASPVLTSYVYREAELTHTGSDALLAGPVNAYLDGRFVGRGEIPSVALGETFVVGFGAEGQLRARRELVDKTENVQGGNRELGFKYRLVIENYRETPVTVRVQDRVPVAQRENEIRVSLAEMKDKLSEESVYLRVERPKGILRWEIEVPARAAGEKARLVEYGYKVEFDRNCALAAPGGRMEQEMQDEFRQLQNERNRK